MKVPRISTANFETEEKYIRTITLYLDINDEENKRKCFDLNRKER